MGKTRRRFPDPRRGKRTLLDAVVLSVACLVTYWLATHVLTRIYAISKNSDLLGGMWAVIATIFVIREGYRQSVAAAISRMAQHLSASLSACST
jgi:hypothetical protein